jgi:glutamate-1-semialdehyde 2,1-aminomutase
MRQIGRDPVFIEWGSGARITDVDGNGYIDWVGSWGPMILGHADADVLSAIEEAAQRGTSFGAPTEDEVGLAEEVTRRVPSVEMLRMTSSGTEAGMSVVRLARAATGRAKILKFAGAYHGHSDALLVDAGSGLATLAVPSSPGVPEGAAEDTVVAVWNDPESVRMAFEQHQFAAVIAEPCPANMGVIPPDPGFLQLLRELADATGALLIFDEVITGFRVARGGYQELAGVTPDLTMFGKIIGGGLPAAAYGGRRELMELVAPAGEVYQAGTLSGNPLATAAGLATLKLLDGPAYEQLAASTERLATGLKAAANDAGVDVCIASTTGLLTVFFTDELPENFADAQACDRQAHATWCRALLSRGVYSPPSQFEAWFVSLAHDEHEIEETIAAAAQAFAKLSA